MKETIIRLVSELIIQFFVYSVAGWCMEVILKFRQYHRFINRGFLIGPYCPIYGSGAVAMTVLLYGFVGSDSRYSDIFLAAFVVCGALEYFVSWYMEKLFHARWWDYSQKPMNLHGRIWIGNLILFGLGGIVIIKWLNPVFFREVRKLPNWAVYVLAILIIVVMVADYIASHVLFHLVREEIDGVDADNSEEVSTKVRILLHNKSLLLRRIGDAYPNLTVSPEVVLENLRRRQEALLQAAREQEKKIAENVKARQEQITENVKAKQEQITENVKARQEQFTENVKAKQEQITENVKAKQEQFAETVKRTQEQFLSRAEKGEEQTEIKEDK